MTIDQLLGKMLDSLEARNTWDTEAYAQMILERIGEVNEDLREDVRKHVGEVLEAAKEQAKQDRFKEDLINQIVNFRG